MILLIDNYDSFTYNLYQMLCPYDEQVKVVRNDACSIADIMEWKPTAIIFSPGPGRPADAGRMEDIIQACYQQIPMLGICLGHQAIAEVFHAAIVQAEHILHGVSSPIQLVQEDALFHRIQSPFLAARYHSLVVKDPSEELIVLACSEEKEIMAVRHRLYPVYGIQFHPESVLTPAGAQIIHNFMKERKQSC